MTERTCETCGMPGFHASMLGCVEALHRALAEARTQAAEAEAVGFAKGYKAAAGG